MKIITGDKKSIVLYKPIHCVEGYSNIAENYIIGQDGSMFYFDPNGKEYPCALASDGRSFWSETKDGKEKRIFVNPLVKKAFK